MTRKDYIIIAECIAECHNKGYDLKDTINCFSYRIHIHTGTETFDATKFSRYIFEKTKPYHIPEEQSKEWAKKKSSKNQ